MKKLGLILLIFTFSLTSFGQSTNDLGKIALSVVMPENVEDLEVTQLSKLETKISQIVTVSGLASSGYNNNFVIYPNPNSGNFNVQFSSNSNNEIKIVVHDLRGREIFANNYNNSGLFNESIQLNNVQSGIYLVTVQDGDRKEVKKIIIE